MTRQKVEILNRIRDLEYEIAVDRALSYGIETPDAHDRAESEIWEVWQQLAHLRHYKSAEDMFYDPRYQEPDPTFPTY